MLGLVLLFLNIGTPELALIMFVALLLFGGDKLPGLARGLGKGIRDFKDASEGVKREITNQIDNFEAKITQQAEVATVETPAAEDEAPVAEKESLVVADENLKLEPPANTMRLSKMISTAELQRLTPQRTEL